MAIFIIILGIIILVGIIVGASMGLFRIEKVEVEDEAGEFDLPEEEGDEYPEDGEDALELDDMTLKEKMDLGGYFGEENATAAQVEADGEGEGGDEKFVMTDRISSFKTGRSYLIDCQKQLNEARAEGNVYAAVYFDFDRFRFINSLKGYSIGDYVLTRMGQELETAFPVDAMLTRVSADHFAALFPVTAMDMFDQISEGLKVICDKIRGDMAIKSGLRVCMGVALTESGERDYDVMVLMHKANVARHCIKVSRSETYKTFESAMLSTYLYGESALDDYTENQFDDEFVIYYMPQEDLSHHRIAGCEAYVRWACEDEADKTLPPHLQKNKIPSNASKVVYQVCKAMSRWRKAGKQPQPVSVSIPITELMKEDVDAFLAKCLQEFQLDPALLCIMIDAPMIRVDWSAISHQLKKIRDIGVKIGVDEIDTGYTNLEFLAGLPLNFIKLHRSFAAGIDEHEDRKQRAGNIYRMAKALNLRAVFDGVDTLDQANALKELGPVWIQGAACGKALKSEEFTQGLPLYVEKQRNSYDSTVILEDAALNKGDFNLF